VSLAAFKDLRPGGLTEAGFAALPILTRAAAQRAGPALRSRAVPKAHGAVQEAATSGSSGTPFTVARSRLDRLMAAAPVQRGRLWNQHDLALPLLAVARMDAARMDAGAPETADGWSEVFPTGPGHTIDLRRPAKEILERICALSPAYVSIWPGLLGELLRLSARRGPAPRGPAPGDDLRRDGAPRPRRPVRRRMGRAAERHLQLRGGRPPGADLPRRPPSHPIRARDRGGSRRCRPPLRRGRDRARGGDQPAQFRHADDPDEAWRSGHGRPALSVRAGLPVLARIEGPVRDLPTLPDGLRVMPSFDERLITAAAPLLRRHQLAQQANGRITVSLVADAPLIPAQQEMLAAAFDAGLGHRFEHEFRAVPAIVGKPGAKSRPWVAR
jgi:hypothetical protein